MSLSTEVYEQVHWRVLRETLDMLLTEHPGNHAPVSFERIHSAVHKCVSHRRGERLYRDLTGRVEAHLEAWENQVLPLRGDEFVAAFHRCVDQFLHAVDLVEPSFIYLDRFYVEVELGTDLRTKLVGMFMKRLGDEAVPRLLRLLDQARPPPDQHVTVPTVKALVERVAQLERKCVDQNQKIFSCHMPAGVWEGEDLAREGGGAGQAQEG